MRLAAAQALDRVEPAGSRFRVVVDFELAVDVAAAEVFADLMLISLGHTPDEAVGRYLVEGPTVTRAATP